jgi:hypothetical protein
VLLHPELEVLHAGQWGRFLAKQRTTNKELSVDSCQPTKSSPSNSTTTRQTNDGDNFHNPPVGDIPGHSRVK